MLKTIAILSVLILFFIPAFTTAATVQPPRTGQTTCYDSNGNVITCAGTGQDGNLRAGVPWPNPRFAVSGDCVKDNLTGLVWARAGSVRGYTWQQALNYVASLNSSGGLCGHSDLRLPNVNELESLVNAEEVSNATWLNGQGFTNVQDEGDSYWGYWSSTTVANGNNGFAWFVKMGNGSVSSGVKSGYFAWYNYVLPVCTGQ